MNNEEKILDILSQIQKEQSEMRAEMSDINYRLRIRNISVIERMEDDIATLKNAVRYLSDKVAQLESAI